MRSLGLVAALLLVLALGRTPGATPREVASVTDGAWSSSSTWADGAVPRAGDRVRIARGTVVAYDVLSDVELAAVTVEGTLAFSRSASTRLTVERLFVGSGGVLDIGTATSPIPTGVTAAVRFVASADPKPDQWTPGLVVVGGRLEIHGAPRGRTWSKLAADARAGSTTVTLADDVSDWRPGDRVVVTGTDRPRRNPALCVGRYSKFNLSCVDPASFGSEEAVVASASGRTLRLKSRLGRHHLGTPPRQGEVGLLSHNVSVASKDPAGRRGHVVIAGGGVARLAHAEFAHLGRPEPGVYPIHFHMVGNAGRDSYVIGAAVWDSQNHFVRVHGTNFLRVADTVGYRALGHGFTTEDGSEAWNTFERNLAVRTTHAESNRNPNDATDRNEGSGFWISNARNYVRGNVAADTDGWGFDLDPPRGRVAAVVDRSGIATGEVPIGSLEVLEFSRNEAHSNYLGGFEMVNFVTAGENAILDLHVWAGGFWDVYLESSARVVFSRLAAHDPGMVFPYQVGYTRFLGSYMGVLDLSGKRHGGWVVLDHSRVMESISGTEGLPLWSSVLVASPNPGARAISFKGGAAASPEPTSKSEMYLLHYDGPGRHVKLVPVGTAPADGMRYRESRRFGLALEAGFSDGEFPALVLPLRIDVGADSDARGERGLRWRLDGPYLPPPPGFAVARYGYAGDSRKYPGDGSIPGSFRSGKRFGYLADLPSGRYQVVLTFLETWGDRYGKGGQAGTRVFDVFAQGTPVIRALDVFQEVGVGVPLHRAFVADVTDGRLALEFVGMSGAMVSAIAVCPETAASECAPAAEGSTAHGPAPKRAETH